MKQAVQDKSKRLKRIGLGMVKNRWWQLVGGLIILTGLMVVIVWMTWQERVLPGVEIAGFKASGYTREELVKTMETLETDYLSQKQKWYEFRLPQDSSQSSKIAVDVEEMGVVFDPIKTTDKALVVGRRGGINDRLREIWVSWREGVNLSHEFSYNQEALREIVEMIGEEVDRPGAEAGVVWENEEIQVLSGENGWMVDKEELAKRVVVDVASINNQEAVIVLKEEDNKLQESEIEAVRTRAELIMEKGLTIRVDGEEGLGWSLTGEDLLGLMEVRGGWSKDKIEDYLVSIAESVNRPAQNALFKFEEGRVSEFAAGVAGLSLNEEESRQQLEESLERLETEEEEVEAVLVADKTEPEIKTPEVNDLGINELIGQGESTYRGSIAGRVHNVALTASKLNGVLVPPGEVFSFNQTIGEVSGATGYQAAYVIRNGRTELGDGGGVCQDSTTLFRAILDAGLPVLERKAHSYRVGYYEQNDKPGFDATVYSPSVDLKFKNDTPGHILIQAKADSENLKLVIELYGTSDGRVAEVTNYQQWAAVPAPPPLYQDDPTLPPGTVKQVDWAAAGLKVKFDYKVTRGGEVLQEETFYSNFRPWQAVYLKGPEV